MEPTKETPQAPEEETIFTPEDYDMQGYDKHIRNARIMLFIVAGIELFSILLIPNNIPDEARDIVIYIQVAVAVAFVGLGIWTKYKPFVALLTAFIFYVGIHTIAAVLDPSSIFSGIVLKIAVIVLLIMGIRNAKEAMDLKKTFGKR